MLRRPPIFTLFPYTTLFRSDNGRVLVRLPVRVLRLNDAVIWAAPVELFCEIAIDVRSRSPFPNTLYFGYTNGWFGYLPTARAFTEGGYEPQTSPFTPAAESDLTRQMVTFLQGAGHEAGADRSCLWSSLGAEQSGRSVHRGARTVLGISE